MISIIVCVYNGEAYLRECLNSLSHQTCKDFEVILVDDGSTDSSAAICEEYAAHCQRCIVLHNENEGPLLARRRGMRQAEGEYILCLDADDCLRSDTVEMLLCAIDQHSPDIICFDFSRAVETTYEGAIVKPLTGAEGMYAAEGFRAIKTAVCEGSFNNLANKVIKRSLLDLNADYSVYAGMRHGEDWLQVIPVMCKAENVFYLDEALYFYREGGQGGTASYKPAQREDLSKVFKQLLSVAKSWGPEFEQAAYRGVCKHSYWLLAGLSRTRSESVAYSVKDEARRILDQAQSYCCGNFSVAIKALRIDFSFPLWAVAHGHIGLALGFIRAEEGSVKILRAIQRATRGE